MVTEMGQVCCERSPDEIIDRNDIQVEPAPRILDEGSISFGRFSIESLSWEKWSSFSQNRCLEELERCSAPGSVAQKKAYFEAYYKRIAAQKALQEQEERAQKALQEQEEQQKALQDQEQCESHKNHPHEDVSDLLSSKQSNEEPAVACTVDYNNSSHTHHQKDTTGSCDLEQHSEEFVLTEMGVCDNTPQGSDAECETTDIFAPYNSMTGDENIGEEACQCVPLQREFQHEETPGEVLSCMVEAKLENGDQQDASDSKSEVEALMSSEVKETGSFGPGQESNSKAVETAVGVLEDVEEKKMASKQTSADLKKLKQKKEPSPKARIETTASIGQKIAPAKNNKVVSSIRISANSTSRASKDQLSSGSSCTAKTVPKALAKQENDVISKRKNAGGNKTESQKLTVSVHKPLSAGASHSNFTVPQPFALSTDKRASHVENLGDKETVKSMLRASQNRLTAPGAFKTEASLNEVSKVAGTKTPRQENGRSHKDSAGRSKKPVAKFKQGEDDGQLVTPKSSHPLSASKAKINPSTSGAAFSFKSNERAEKRKEAVICAMQSGSLYSYNLPFQKTVITVFRYYKCIGPVLHKSLFISTRQKKSKTDPSPVEVCSLNKLFAYRLHVQLGTLIFSLSDRIPLVKQFYMKLEEKMNAKEAERNQIQAKTQEEKEAEIKKLRKNLKFKATPMPNFYQEAGPPKTEIKKIPPTRAKSPKLGRKYTNCGTGIHNSLRSGKTGSDHEDKNTGLGEKHLDVPERNREAPQGNDSGSLLKKAQKKASPSKSLTEKQSTRVLSADLSMKGEMKDDSAGSFSTKATTGGLEAEKTNSKKDTSPSIEQSGKHANISSGLTADTGALLADMQLSAGQEQGLVKDIVAASVPSEKPDMPRNSDQPGAGGYNEIIEVKTVPQKIDDSNYKVATKRSDVYKDNMQIS
eukprot:Gb_03209 [translate_table: standard]